MYQYKKRLFVIFLCLILLPILLYPGWLADDTYWIISHFKFQPFFFTHMSYFENGDRFQPLFNVLNQLISFLYFKPVSFFIFNYVIALSSVLVLMILLKKIFAKFWYLPIIIIFTPAFSSHFYLIHTAKELLLFWSLFLYLFFIPFLKNEKNPSNYIFLSLIPANIALYLKENNFVLLSVFAFTLLLLNRLYYRRVKDKTVKYSGFSKNVKILLYLFLLSSFIFFIQYLIFSEFRGSDSYFSDMTPEWSIISRIKYSAISFIKYIISDPILFLVLPLLSLFSHLVHKKANKEENECFLKNIYVFDSLSIAAIMFAFSYIALGFFNYRYLLPAYPFIILAIMGYSSILYRNIKLLKNTISKHKYLNLSIFIVIGIFVLNSVFHSINTAVYLKYTSCNFMKFNNEIVKIVDNKLNSDTLEIRINYPGTVSPLYYERMNLNMLHYLGYEINADNDMLNNSWRTPESFKIGGKTLYYLCETKTHNWMVKPDKNDFNNIDVRQGDIFLFMPTTELKHEDLLNNLEGLHLKCIMKTDSPYYFELPEITPILKKILLQIEPSLFKSKKTNKNVDFAIYEVV